MTRYQFDRERLLTELSDFGIGFQQGLPTARKTTDLAFKLVRGYCLGVCGVVLLSLIWARWA